MQISFLMHFRHLKQVSLDMKSTKNKCVRNHPLLRFTFIVRAKIQNSHGLYRFSLFSKYGIICTCALVHIRNTFASFWISFSLVLLHEFPWVDTRQYIKIKLYYFHYMTFGQKLNCKQLLELLTMKYM